MHDLLKPSIRLKEDILACSPGASLNEGSSVPIPRTPPGEKSPASISEASLGASAGPTTPIPGPEGDVAAIIGPPSPKADWKKPIAEYLRLGIIPDDETGNRLLAHRANGYLIHNNEVYRWSTSGILQRCIPLEEGKALLFDIHEGICGHRASSRSMVGKAFRQGLY
jgi:hypothetical protein